VEFDELMRGRRWVPIRGCPGRFILGGGPVRLRPEELAGPGCEPKEYSVAGARDTVVVVRFNGGGLISYRKAGGEYLHTLNTEEGLGRKLAQLGLTSRADEGRVRD
jgi:hypothetical protein